MAYTAHITGADGKGTPGVIVRDDRGVPAAQFSLAESPTAPEQAEDRLHRAGWAITAAWSTTDQGWAAPVERQ